MCDYSLMSIPNRLAREGDELVVHRFETGAIGLAAACDLRSSPSEPAGRPRTFWSAVKDVFTSHQKRVPAVLRSASDDPAAKGRPEEISESDRSQTHRAGHVHADYRYCEPLSRRGEVSQWSSRSSARPSGRSAGARASRRLWSGDRRSAPVLGARDRRPRRDVVAPIPA
jgi:hypothetical protein